MNAPDFYFKCTALQVSANRDESLLKLSLQMADGKVVVVDFNGELITALQAHVNGAIQSVPGLAVWKQGS